MSVEGKGNSRTVTNQPGENILDGITLGRAFLLPLAKMPESIFERAGATSVESIGRGINGVFDLSQILVPFYRSNTNNKEWTILTNIYPGMNEKKRLRFDELNLDDEVVVNSWIRNSVRGSIQYDTSAKIPKNKTRYDPWFLSYGEEYDEMWSQFNEKVGPKIINMVFNRIEPDPTKQVLQLASWEEKAKGWKICLVDVARAAKMIVDGSKDFQMMADKCVYIEGKNKKCAICHLLPVFSADGQEKEAIKYQDDDYIVTAKDKGCEVMVEYPYPGRARDYPSYIIWVKRDRFGTKVCKLSKTDVEMERRRASEWVKNIKLPFLDETYRINYHIDSDEWNHLHFQLTPTMKETIKVRSIEGQLKFNQRASDVITRMLSLLYRLYTTWKHEGRMPLSNGFDLPLPLMDLISDSGLDGYENGIYLSAIEWYLFMLMDLSVPVAMLHRLDESNKLNKGLSFEQVWDVWMEARECIEFEVHILKLVRQGLFGYSKKNKYYAYRRFFITERAYRMLNYRKTFPSAMTVMVADSKGYDILPNTTMVVDRRYTPRIQIATLNFKSSRMPTGKHKDFPMIRKKYEEARIVMNEVDDVDFAKMLENMGLIIRTGIHAAQDELKTSEAEAQTE